MVKKNGANVKGRVHAVNITDGSRAALRMCSFVSRILLQNWQMILSLLADRKPNWIAADGLGRVCIRVILANWPCKAGDHVDAKAYLISNQCD